MAIRQKTTIKVRLKGQGHSHSHCDVMVRDLTSTIDEPVERGGTNLGFSPTETAYAALVGCTNTIGHKCADKLGVDIGTLSFDMVVDFDRRGVMLIEEIDIPFTAIRLSVTAAGSASDADLQRVAEETAKYCAVSKMFVAAGTEVEVNWAKG
ncbi:OsmC family protein [Thalassobius sp. MITS945101]|uniref:OsmC family protein n=1 Tax=Thalassobius sp. MITS945101 TaxID=3096994 RepID=UPI00399A32E9